MPRLYIEEYTRILAGRHVSIACREGILRDHLAVILNDIKFLNRQGVVTTLFHNMANRFANAVLYSDRYVGEVIDFLQEAFGAVALRRIERPDGSLMHGEVRIDDSVVMLGEPEREEAWTPTPAHVHIYVPDVDAAFRRALAAGPARWDPVSPSPAPASGRWSGTALPGPGACPGFW